MVYWDENATLFKEKNGQFYCYQITTKSNVNSVSIERKTKERTKTTHVSEHRIHATWAEKKKKKGVPKLLSKNTLVFHLEGALCT